MLEAIETIHRVDASAVASSFCSTSGDCLNLI